MNGQCGIPFFHPPLAQCRCSVNSAQNRHFDSPPIFFSRFSDCYCRAANEVEALKVSDKIGKSSVRRKNEFGFEQLKLLTAPRSADRKIRMGGVPHLRAHVGGESISVLGGTGLGPKPKRTRPVFGLFLLKRQLSRTT